MTAVEWLRQELLKRDMDNSIKDLFEQAKEMEKEQIIDAHCDWARLTDNLPTRTAEQYYNETFKSE
jgi:hypothetical protein